MKPDLSMNRPQLEPFFQCLETFLPDIGTDGTETLRFRRGQSSATGQIAVQKLYF